MQPSVIAEVSAVVNRITGVQLGERQRIMVESRLKRRISELGLDDEVAYLHYLRANPASETEALVSLLTTHHTFFFRESLHFDFLEERGLKTLVEGLRKRGEKKLRVWSAACSRGQEVYTLAMFLAQHLPAHGSDLDFEILGTDVDTESVKIAQNGVYHKREVKQVPASYLADHWAKGTGDIADYVKVKKALKTHCSFKPANLMESASLVALGRFDLIFCRNVFIYFTPEQIAKIGRALTDAMQKTGMLVIGVSESLNGLNLSLQPCGPSIYSHAEVLKPAAAVVRPIAETREATLVSTPKAPAAAQGVVSALKRVLCVDDSASVLAVLKQVLQESHGFQVVGTANSGLDAVEKVKRLAPDLVTLDIHMPEMTGLEYLKKHWSPSHPPVIVVSSVAREDASLAMQCLAAGASDYVEKPALANLAERGDEIRMKLTSAFKRARRGTPAPSSLDRMLASSLPETPRSGSISLILASLGDEKPLAATLKELQQACGVVTVVLTEGLGATLPAMAASLTSRIGKDVKAFSGVEPPSSGIYLGDLSTHWQQALSGRKREDASVMVFGDLSSSATRFLQAWPAAQVLIEDLPRAQSQQIPEFVSDVFPTTSFAYMARLFLCRKR